jgi:hypothetical protein
MCNCLLSKAILPSPRLLQVRHPAAHEPLLPRLCGAGADSAHTHHRNYQVWVEWVGGWVVLAVLHRFDAADPCRCCLLLPARHQLLPVRLPTTRPPAPACLPALLCSFMMGCLYVDREAVAKDDSQPRVSDLVRQRMDDMAAGRLPPRPRPLLLFPEGTTTNGRFLLPFKTGAFLAGQPLQPVVLRYGEGEVGGWVGGWAGGWAEGVARAAVGRMPSSAGWSRGAQQHTILEVACHACPGPHPLRCREASRRPGR